MAVRVAGARDQTARWRPVGPRRSRRQPADFEVPRTGSVFAKSSVRLLEQLFMVAIVLISVVPLYAMVITSLKGTAQFNDNPGSLLPPSHLSFTKYAEAWNDLGFSTMMKNSLILSIVSAVGTTSIATAAGFAMSRLRFGGRRAILIAMIAFMSVPVIAVIVPLFVLMSRWGILNTYSAAPLAEIGLGLPFASYLVYTFMREIPHELFQAAAVDGASAMRQFFHVALPLSRPVIITVALIMGIFAWNDLLIPLVLWQSPDLQVLMVGLANLAPGHTGAVDIPLLMAGVSISIVPVIALFLAARHFFIEGFLSGSLKG
jgi:ABC-type glycerol-3-phosphate transport system permease component